MTEKQDDTRETDASIIINTGIVKEDHGFYSVPPIDEFEELSPEDRYKAFVALPTSAQRLLIHLTSPLYVVPVSETMFNFLRDDEKRVDAKRQELVEQGKTDEAANLKPLWTIEEFDQARELTFLAGYLSWVEEVTKDMMGRERRTTRIQVAPVVKSFITTDLKKSGKNKKLKELNK